MSKVIIFLGIAFFVVGCDTEKPDPKPQANETIEKEIGAKVIYGNDNRLDLYQVESAGWKKTAASTVALIRNVKIAAPVDGKQTLQTTNYGAEYRLCNEEPFREQSTAAFCSGFYIGNNLMVSAGHCLRTQNDCDATSFVFGFAVQKENELPQALPTNNIYRCKRLLKTAIDNNTGADYSISEVDRDVVGFAPLTMRNSGSAAIGDELVVIGHPAGLPTKVAAEAFVRSLQTGFMVASLDTYGGNSGSAVFNAQTGDVEGILVRGEMDFRYKDSCRVSNVCTQESCRGEDVTKIEYVQRALNNL